MSVAVCVVVLCLLCGCVCGGDDWEESVTLTFDMGCTPDLKNITIQVNGVDVEAAEQVDGDFNALRIIYTNGSMQGFYTYMNVSIDDTKVNLTIRNLTANDEGLYTCICDAHSDSTNASQHLQVTPVAMDTRAGAIITLSATCETSTHARWIVNGQVVAFINDKRFVAYAINGTIGMHKLTLHTLIEEAGIYIIECLTTEGEYQRKTYNVSLRDTQEHRYPIAGYTERNGMPILYCGSTSGHRTVAAWYTQENKLVGEGTLYIIPVDNKDPSLVCRMNDGIRTYEVVVSIPFMIFGLRYDVCGLLLIVILIMFLLILCIARYRCINHQGKAIVSTDNPSEPLVSHIEGVGVLFVGCKQTNSLPQPRVLDTSDTRINNSDYSMLSVKYENTRDNTYEEMMSFIKV